VVGQVKDGSIIMLKIDEDLKELYRECLSTWGFEKQARVAQEECAEFIVAASHMFRNRPNKLEDFIEELADAYIMLGQMMVYVGEDKVTKVIEEKIPKIKMKMVEAIEKELRVLEIIERRRDGGNNGIQD
jgi:hypothetical protein